MEVTNYQRWGCCSKSHGTGGVTWQWMALEGQEDGQRRLIAVGMGRIGSFLRAGSWPADAVKGGDCGLKGDGSRDWEGRRWLRLRRVLHQEHVPPIYLCERRLQSAGK